MQIQAASEVGANIVELHTGRYCELQGEAQRQELNALQKAAELAVENSLECHAGHGLTYETVGAVAAIPQIVELNIGHFLIGQAVFEGLEPAIRQMRHLMDKARV